MAIATVRLGEVGGVVCAVDIITGLQRCGQLYSVVLEVCLELMIRTLPQPCGKWFIVEVCWVMESRVDERDEVLEESRIVGRRFVGRVFEVVARRKRTRSS